jgi:diguanylate cyclase (GGDEF)-like protein/PAS domain S-box-containing protein
MQGFPFSVHRLGCQETGMQNQAAANLKALIESTKDLVWSVDLDERLIAYNSALATYILLAFHTKLALGMRVHELFPDDRREIFHGYYERAIREGAFRTEYTQMAGTTLELSLNPIDDEGQVSGVSVFARDITAHKLDEEALRHLAAAVESSQDAIITHSPDSKILTWNRAAERMFGYRAEEAIGRKLTLIVPPERAELVNAYYAQVLSGNIRHETGGVGIHRDGHAIHLQLSSWPIRNAAGEITAVSDAMRDVSSEVDAERARGLLVAMVECSDDAIHLVSVDGFILSWNAGAERICGYTREEIVGKHISFLVCMPADLITETIERLATGIAVPNFDAIYRNKNGSLVDVSVSVSQVRDASGAVIGMAGIARDITPRKRLERALMEAEQKYRSIFDGALEGMFQASLKGRITTANAAAARLLGYESVHEMLGMRGARLWVESAALAQFTHAIVNPEGKPVLGFECQVYRKDGQRIWVALNGRMVNDERGRAHQVEGFFEDITERKLAAEAMAESEERFRKLFEDSSTVLLLIEPESGEIVDANHAAEVYYGYARAQLVGAEIAMLNKLPPDEIKAERARALHEERKYFSFRHVLASGEERDVRVYSSPITIDGRVLLYSIIFDVTEQKKTEQQLRETAAILTAAQRIGGLGNYDLDISTGSWSSSEMLDEIFGILPEYEHNVDGWSELIHPDDRSMMSEHLRLVLAQGRAFDKEYRIVRPSDGAERWVHGLGKVEYSADGKPLRMHGVIKDITEHKQAEIALRSSESRYRTAFRMSIDPMTLSRIQDSVIIDVNNAFLEAMASTREQVLGRMPEELGVWEDLADLAAVRLALRSDGVCRNYQCRFRSRDGRRVWGTISVSLVEVDGELCALSTTRDITQIKQAEEKLAQAQLALKSSEERYRTVFQASLDCISITRQRDDVIIDVNQSYLDMLGFDLDEVMGHTCADLNLWAEQGARERMDEVLHQNGSFRDARTRYRRKNGALLWVLISSSMIEIEGEPCVLTIIRDVSDAKAAEDKIWNLAFYDPLTRLPNRRLLMDRLRQMLNQSRRNLRMRALLFIDLDNFKTLNDTLGHQNGDQLLREMARRLVGCVRESDTVARLGGDEFVILLDGLDYHPENAAQQVEAVSYKILAAIEQPFWLDSREYFSTSSIGVTIFSGNDFNADDLLQQADIAMYQAKNAGRNTLRFFEPALQTAVQERAALGDQMRVALRVSQFSLHLQPQMDSHGMIGAEALVRWHHPFRGLLYPGEFIPLAEETGLILQLGEQVLEAACNQIAEWTRRTPAVHLCLSVNISARQFYQASFVSQVLALLKHTGAAPSLLNLEITESILLDNIEEAIEKMHQLKSHGVRFSLDDFGTGYSSLSYLKRLPFDQLKIDRSFVRDLRDDMGSRAIAQTVISLGQALNLDVLAEGVETEEQRILLEELGCHSFQGYLFGRPVPLEEFERRWLPATQTTGD